MRSDLLALGIGTKNRFEVMPLGLDLERFRSVDTRRGELRAELGLGAVPLIGIVARLAPVKAHNVFLRAAAALRERMPDVHFVVVGDGELRASLEALASDLGLGGCLTFLGWRSDVERVYADLDLVVLSSRNEGSPIALIEAMASGRNVVATAAGGVPDVVRHGETGLLVNPDNPAALARVDGGAAPRRFGAARGDGGRGPRRRVRAIRHSTGCWPTSIGSTRPCCPEASGRRRRRRGASRSTIHARRLPGLFESPRHRRSRSRWE